MSDFANHRKKFKSFKHFVQYNYDLNNIFIDSYLGKTFRYLPLNNTHSILLNFYLLHVNFYETPICQITPNLYDLMCDDELGNAILNKLSKINSNKKVIALQIDLYKYKSDIFLKNYYNLMQKDNYVDVLYFFINKTNDIFRLTGKTFSNTEKNKNYDAFEYFFSSNAISYSSNINEISKSIINFAISREYKYEKLVPIIMYYLYKNPKKLEYEMEDKYHFLNSILLSEYYANYAFYNSDIYYNKENNSIFLAPKINAYIFIFDTINRRFYRVLSQKSINILLEILERLPREIKPKRVKMESKNTPSSLDFLAIEELSYKEAINNEIKFDKILEQDIFVRDINSISIFEYSFREKDAEMVYKLGDYIEIIKNIIS